MKHVLSTYVIQRDCKVLLPEYTTDYDTVVWTATGHLYVKKTPLEIIEESCHRDFASYEGRRKLAMKLTGYEKKVPIPINISQKIYAFPTISPTSPDCIWIIAHHIKKIEKITGRSNNMKFQSIVHFWDGSSMPFEISAYSLSEQRKRTSYCKDLLESIHVKT